MTSDPLDLQGIDYVEFYVANARQAGQFVEFRSLESGVRMALEIVVFEESDVVTELLTPEF